MEDVIPVLTRLLTEYVLRIAGVLVLLFIAFRVAALAERRLRAVLEGREIDRTVARFVATIARWGLILLSVIAALGVFGVETTSFAAAIGAAGLAIGLAFQGSLSNFAAGVMLLVFRPFKVGDVVEIAGKIGEVQEISLIMVIIDTFDRRRIVIPNSSVLGGVVENFTHHPVRRVDLAVGVAYDSDLDHTREVLVAAANDIEGALEDPPPKVILGDLEDSAVLRRVRVWATGADFWDVRERAIEKIKKALDEADIEIPFPQVSVHMDK